MAKLTDTQIKQIIGNIEASIDKIESELSRTEYLEYCDHAFSLITYWKAVAKNNKESEEN